LANQDNGKCHINGIAAESKNATRYKTVGTVRVNADTKALPKRNQAPQYQQQPHEAEQHADPRDRLGMEKFLRADGRPIECGGEHDIEVEEGKWDDHEIRFVDIPELNGLYSLSFQEKDAGQYHPKQ
jgi:hypothetical protein